MNQKSLFVSLALFIVMGLFALAALFTLLLLDLRNGQEALGQQLADITEKSAHASRNMERGAPPLSAIGRQIDQLQLAVEQVLEQGRDNTHDEQYAVRNQPPPPVDAANTGLSGELEKLSERLHSVTTLQQQLQQQLQQEQQTISRQLERVLSENREQQATQRKMVELIQQPPPPPEHEPEQGKIDTIINRLQRLDSRQQQIEALLQKIGKEPEKREPYSYRAR